MSMPVAERSRSPERPGKCATCDASNFSFTEDADLIGDLEVTTTDEWGQTSNAADVELDEVPLAVEQFSAMSIGNNTWEFQGRWWEATRRTSRSTLAGLPQ